MNNHAQHYQRVSLDSEYDVILIGSGVGCLATGSLLSQIGKKVLILEQHYVLGGYTQTFSRKGKYKWDVGVHYIPDVIDRNSMSRIGFDLVSQGRLKWHETDTAYDRVIVGTREIDYVKGRRTLIKSLKEKFPEESAGIDRYFREVMTAVAASVGFFAGKGLSRRNPAKVFLTPSEKVFKKYSSQTAKEVLDRLFKNEELKTFLGAQCGDYGLPPGQASFVMHSIVTSAFVTGAAYPVGGADSIARSIASVIAEHGGTLVTKARVEQILVKDNKAYGVRMTDGKEIKAQRIVSGVGVFNTIESLLPPDVVHQHGLEAQLSTVSRSCSHLALHIGFNKGNQDLNLPDRNYWIYPTGKIDDAFADYKADRDSEIPMLFVNFPSAKDPQWSAKHPDSSTAVVLIFEEHETFAPWENTEWHKRGPEYEALKKKFETRILAYFGKYFPELRSSVAYTEVSTPLSTQHFMNYKKGEIYGVAMEPRRFEADWLTPATPVENLFLTGVDVTVDSVPGALGSGYMCALSMERAKMMAFMAKKVAKLQWDYFTKSSDEVLGTASPIIPEFSESKQY